MCKCKDRTNFLNKDTKKLYKVGCHNCDSALYGIQGEKYPIHLIDIIVSKNQIETWKEQGNDIYIIDGPR